MRPLLYSAKQTHDSLLARTWWRCRDETRVGCGSWGHLWLGTKDDDEGQRARMTEGTLR
jgi:hypothetical protein